MWHEKPREAKEFCPLSQGQECPAWATNKRACYYKAYFQTKSGKPIKEKYLATCPLVEGE